MFEKMMVVGLVLGSTAVVSQATLVKIQPDEFTSQDTFVYSRLPTGNATGVFQLTGDPEAAVSASKHLAITTFTTSTTTHMHSLIKLPIASLQVDPGEQAVIGLWSQVGFLSQAATPSTTYPVTLSLYPLTGSWNEDITWNQHGAGGFISDTAVASVQVSGINQWVEFDITDYLASLQPRSYEGFAIIQYAAVTEDVKPVGVFFAGAGDTTASLRPYIAVIPEPATLGLLSIASLLLRRRR